MVANSNGGVLNYNNYRRDVWNPTVKTAGVPGLTPHDLRHTYVSWLLQDKVSLEAVSKLLGHASTKTTERYAHLADSQWDEVREFLERPASTKTLRTSADKPAPYLLHENNSAAGAKIIDLASHRRSAG